MELGCQGASVQVFELSSSCNRDTLLSSNCLRQQTTHCTSPFGPVSAVLRFRNLIHTDLLHVVSALLHCRGTLSSLSEASSRGQTTVPRQGCPEETKQHGSSCAGPGCSFPKNNRRHWSFTGKPALRVHYPFHQAHSMLPSPLDPLHITQLRTTVLLHRASAWSLSGSSVRRTTQS